MVAADIDVVACPVVDATALTTAVVDASAEVVDLVVVDALDDAVKEVIAALTTAVVDATAAAVEDATMVLDA
jgi:hypothetical protein